MGTWKRRERVKACRPYTIVEEGGGNQSGDCESAKLDPLLPRSRQGTIHKGRSHLDREGATELPDFADNQYYTNSTRLQTRGIGCQKI